MTDPSAAPWLDVRDLVKRFAPDVVVGPLSFSVKEGEFFSLLGPSGCGKTTTLRCIAGFEVPTAGAIRLRGERIEEKPAHRREIGLVFQSYALFPHLTVFENVAFGLTLRRLAKPEIETRVKRVLDLVGLGTLGPRYPSQISGGQQQRVAVARSLVLEPPLLLLDEPLSNLDLKLRVQMRQELRQLQRKLGKTAIYVTHDQTEALALSDRIAVLSHGRIEQIGTAAEIYERPATAFVADFIGSSNMIEGHIVARDGNAATVETNGGPRLVVAECAGDLGAGVLLMIRPERLHIAGDEGAGAPGANRLRGRVDDVTYLGEDVHVKIMAGNRLPLLVSLKNAGFASHLATGQAVHIQLAPADIRVVRK